MKEIYYWSPCLEKVGTYWSTINSAISLAKFSNNNYLVKIINVCGEWDAQKIFLNNNGVELIDLGFNYFKFLPKSGYLKSRLSYIIIFILSFFPLIKLLLNKKSNFFVIHLITSLPIIVFSILDLKTKLILRISGFPKLNFFRTILWKMISKKIYKITCPSRELKNQLLRTDIFSGEKLVFLADPIIKVKKFIRKVEHNKNNYFSPTNKNYFISVGRLTKQKNFGYLIDEFYEFSKINNEIDLLIFGVGEDKKKLLNKIHNYNMQNRVFLMGYSDQIYQYMRNAKAFILSSLWEDPGFVMVEAAMCNLLIISSDCKNGPSEFLSYGKGGILFKSNEKGALKKALNHFLNEEKISKNKKILTKKMCLKYTLFRHFKSFNKSLT